MYKGSNSYRHLDKYTLSVDLNATGLRIFNLMVDAGFEVKDVQLACGFSTPQSVYKWLSGKNCPSVDHLIILRAMFNVPIDEMIISKNSEDE